MSEEKFKSNITSQVVNFLPKWNIVFHKSKNEIKEIITEILTKTFNYSESDVKNKIKEINKNGKAVVFTAHKEYAELKKEQIDEYSEIKEILITTLESEGQ